MTIDTWVSLAALLGVAVSLGGLMVGQTRSVRGDVACLDAKIDANRLEAKADLADVRDELKGEIAGLRTELKGEIAGLRTELKGDIGRLDDRVYALAAGLRPRIEESHSPAASGE
jgi:hypothetical protein